MARSAICDFWLLGVSRHAETIWFRKGESGQPRGIHAVIVRLRAKGSAPHPNAAPITAPMVLVIQSLLSQERPGEVTAACVASIVTESPVPSTIAHYAFL